MALSWIYAIWGDTGALEGLFFGLKAAVLAIVVEAVLRIGRRALKTRFLVGLAAASFVAIFAFNVPFPLLVAAAALVGWLASRLAPSLIPKAAVQNAHDDSHYVVDGLLARGSPRWGKSGKAA